jgi:hypothetical protein
VRVAPISIALLLFGCGGGPSCTRPLPATHLYEGYCPGSSGFCLTDQQTGF